MARDTIIKGKDTGISLDYSTKIIYEVVNGHPVPVGSEIKKRKK